MGQEVDILHENSTTESASKIKMEMYTIHRLRNLESDFSPVLGLSMDGIN